MTQVFKISRTSLPTSSSYNKYFYLKNKYTISDTSYTYICLEDDGFGLSYNNVKCCLRAYNPSSNPDNAVNYCTSPLINYYSIQSSSGTTKYFYKIPVSMSVYEYSIVYYEGNYSFGSLYVIYDYNDLSSIITTQVLINSRISLPTNSSLDKYFYITNKDFSKYSSDNIYFYLEYQGFNLNYNRIRYCFTNTDPYYSPYEAVKNCVFDYIYYYDHKELSSSTKYHYQFVKNDYLKYTIVHYDGNYSSGSLYVYFDYESTSNLLPTKTIVCIVIASIAFLGIIIINTYDRCPCCKKNKNDFGPETQPILPDFILRSLHK